MARTTIRSDDITDGQVAIADLSATGTASSSTALYGDNTWKTVVTSPVGGGTEKIFYENEQSVDVDYTVTANNNAMILEGITYTVRFRHRICGQNGFGCITPVFS